MRCRPLVVLIVTCIPAFTSCTSAPSVAVIDDFRASENAARLQVIDQRADSDKSTEVLSYLVTSCDYAIRRLGDEVTTPSRLVLLQNDLARELGPVVEGKVLTVNRYTIHYNNSAVLRGAVYPGGAGAVGAVMKGIGSHCPREKTSGGWYEASEVNGPHSPLIVEIEATFGSQSLDVRTVYTPDQEFSRFGEPAAARALFGAMERAHTLLAASIRRGETSSP